MPDARLRDIGLFAQDEWRIRPKLSLVAGLRGDFYSVATEPTPGYDVDASSPARVRRSTRRRCPIRTARPTHAALTGDIGLIVNPGGALTPFIRFGRSYRHPNLEEMLFAGPATIGSIAPNVTVRPETGNNFDLGAKFVVGRVSGGAYGFLNRYPDFIAQDLVVASTPAGPLAQATNYADVRIGGIEMSRERPSRRSGRADAGGVRRVHARHDRRGHHPLNGAPLDGTPADNITPSRMLAAVRFTEPRGRWWAEYGFRAQGEVTRVARRCSTRRS